MTLEQFIRDHRIRAEVFWTDRNPNIDGGQWSAGARHFKVILRRGGQRFTVPFSQGPAIEREPTAADVLDSLASDASGFDSCKSFEDWCGDYGYDTDSRRAEKTFRAIEHQTGKLRTFLGEEAFRALLLDCERL